jgi:hypothetical protein
VERKEVLLPELLSMDGTPSKTAALAYFLLEFINGRESFLVLVKEFKNLVEEFINVSINPVSILKLDNSIEDSDIGHDFMATLT